MTLLSTMDASNKPLPLTFGTVFASLLLRAVLPRSRHNQPCSWDTYAQGAWCAWKFHGGGTIGTCFVRGNHEPASPVEWGKLTYKGSRSSTTASASCSNNTHQIIIGLEELNAWFRWKQNEIQSRDGTTDRQNEHLSQTFFTQSNTSHKHNQLKWKVGKWMCSHQPNEKAWQKKLIEP